MTAITDDVLRDLRVQLENVAEDLENADFNDMTEIIDIAVDLQGIINALMQYVQSKMGTEAETSDDTVQT